MKHWTWKARCTKVSKQWCFSTMFEAFHSKCSDIGTTKKNKDRIANRMRKCYCPVKADVKDIAQVTTRQPLFNYEAYGP
eukprot:5955558-Amphidinium_carterae.1